VEYSRIGLEMRDIIAKKCRYRFIVAVSIEI
jgi:hypothetical protein